MHATMAIIGAENWREMKIGYESSTVSIEVCRVLDGLSAVFGFLPCVTFKSLS
jgi:hypothetical protein